MDLNRAGLMGLLVCVIGICGCSNNTPRYATPTGDDSLIASVGTDGVYMDSVDGAHVEDRHHVKVAPGTHTIKFSFSNAFGGYRNGGGQEELSTNFTAGGQYVIRKDTKMFHHARFALIDAKSGAEVETVGGDSAWKDVLAP